MTWCWALLPFLTQISVVSLQLRSAPQMRGKDFLVWCQHRSGMAAAPCPWILALQCCPDCRTT